MQSTGIVRRLDDLGRVVVPKEVRRVLRLKEGDPIEICTGRDEQGSFVTLRKYSAMGAMGDFANEYAESLHESTGLQVLVIDNESILAHARPPRERSLKNGRVGKDLDAFMDSSQESATYTMVKDGTTKEGRISSTEIPVVAFRELSAHGEEAVHAVHMRKVLVSGEAVGAIVVYSDDRSRGITEMDKKLVETVALFLSKAMRKNNDN